MESSLEITSSLCFASLASLYSNYSLVSKICDDAQIENDKEIVSHLFHENSNQHVTLIRLITEAQSYKNCIENATAQIMADADAAQKRKDKETNQ